MDDNAFAGSGNGSTIVAAVNQESDGTLSPVHVLRKRLQCRRDDGSRIFEAPRPHEHLHLRVRNVAVVRVTLCGSFKNRDSLIHASMALVYPGQLNLRGGIVRMPPDNFMKH